MAITTALCNSAKQEFLQGLHLSSHTYKLALFQATATLDSSTTAYASTNEITGTNYTAGGASLGSASYGLSGGIGYLDFADLTFTNLTANQAIGGCLIYNDSLSPKRALAVYAFPQTYQPTAEDFKLFIPSGGNGLIRIG